MKDQIKKLREELKARQEKIVLLQQDQRVALTKVYALLSADPTEEEAEALQNLLDQFQP